METDKAVTETALRNIGRLHLGRGLKPTEDVRARVPQRPDLDYQRPVLLAREQAGIAGTYRVSSWGLTLPVRDTAPGEMEVGMMQRFLS